MRRPGSGQKLSEQATKRGAALQLQSIRDNKSKPLLLEASQAKKERETKKRRDAALAAALAAKERVQETSEDDAKNFDTEFVKVDQATLFELILVRTAPRVRALGRARSRTGRDEISPLKRALFRALILISFSRGPVRFR